MHELTALVTGATAGIGFQIARELARGGARVLITGRDAVRGQLALNALREYAGHDRIELLHSDASSLRANIALAQEVSARAPRLDLLINNVGGTSARRSQTNEGLEHTFALNFAGPFALTTRLLPNLAASPQGQIIQVVSSALFMWKHDPLHDVESRQRYVGIEAYGHAKQLNLLFGLALNAGRVAPHVRVNAVNPGMAWTPGVSALTPDAVPQWRYIWPLVRWFQRRAEAEVAARGPLALAQSHDLQLTGAYFDELKRKELPSALTQPELLARIWALGSATLSRVLTSSNQPRIHE